MAERKHQKITIVKMPKILAEWVERYDGNTEIGVLEASEDQMLLRIHSTIGPENFPQEWLIESLGSKRGMFTFQSRGQEASIDGVVSEEVYIRPKMSPGYLKYKRDRAEAIASKKEVKSVDSLKEGIRMEKYGASEYDIMARRRKKMLLDKKRERLAKPEVMDIIFRAFEEYPYWSLKDLSDRSGQPQAYIQEILSEIAVLNKRMHKNMYELKPEYK